MELLHHPTSIAHLRAIDVHIGALDPSNDSNRSHYRLYAPHGLFIRRGFSALNIKFSRLV